MKTIETFQLRKLVRLLNKARRVAEVPAEGPGGWSQSSVDPMELLAVFKPLRLKQGFVLRAYLFREGGNGNGVVYAMSENLPFPEPGECEYDDSRFLSPPVPYGALDDAMEAIEGEGSLWSYLAASLLSRELEEFGAMWHGCNWSTHEILGKNPIHAPTEEGDSLLRESSHQSNLAPRDWNWLGPKPEEWRPIVLREGISVTVVFHTFSDLGRETIYRHVDRYKAGSYCFRSELLVLAEGPGGCVF
jgi:hypothetical protein